MPIVEREISHNNNNNSNSDLSSEVLSPWISGGSVGTKDAVLVFRTSALHNSSVPTCALAAVSTGSVSSTKSSLTESSLSTSDAYLHDYFDASDKTTSTYPSKLLPPIGNQQQQKSGGNYGKKQKNELLQMTTSASEPMITGMGYRDVNGMKGHLMKSASTDDGNANKSMRGASDLLPTHHLDMPAALLNIRYRFINTESRLLRRVLTSHGIRESTDDSSFNILWTGVHLKADVLRNLLPYQRVNHFPRSYELTRKDRLYKNIEQMQHLRGFKHFDIVPETYMLPLEYKDFVAAHNKYRGPWIVKPVASSRGRGIFIIHSPEQVPPDEQLLVAKYLANPLCIDGFKCDVRLYVAVTSFDPLLIYLYEEGLVRLATVKYDTSTEYLWNSCMHLCNYSINKYHSDYIKSLNPAVDDYGNKWTLSALLRHLKRQGCDTDQMMLNIEDLVIKAIFSCTQSVAAACRMFVPNINNCFELYGFDILIDDTLKPWLLEVNLSPSLSADSPIDVKVKASLLCDLLNLIGVPAIGPSLKAAYDNHRMVGKGGGYRGGGIGHTGSLNKRRASSADFIQNPSRKSMPATTMTLSNEEAKIVRSAKMQAERCKTGGFVRIFPTENSLLKYGAYMDPLTGIPTSMTSTTQSYSMINPRNLNAMLHGQLYGQKARSGGGAAGGLDAGMGFADRMEQYERPLEMDLPVANAVDGKCQNRHRSGDEGRRLRKQLCRLIENGSELNQLQARRAFQLYLELVLKRLTVEPKLCHEKLVLKFMQRSGATGFKLPPFISNPSHKIMSKDRSALILKMFSDYIENYMRDTEAVQEAYPYTGGCGGGGGVPHKIFVDFMATATEQDLETLLTVHTNVTNQLPFLYDRRPAAAPLPPAHAPIPASVDGYGFLKALPNIAPRGPTKDTVRIDMYYKTLEGGRMVGERKK